jgi:peroxiredoxin
VTIHDEQVQVPDPEQLVHLQFRRYAGCPICNLHLRSVARRHEEIVAAGVREVVIFHSSAETMLEFQGELPFAVIADPDRELYAEFGVGTSLKAVMSPRTWWASPRATPMVLSARNVRGTMGFGEQHLGLPADFLIDCDGQVLAAKYGRYANDQWSVDELLDLARAGRGAHLSRPALLGHHR